MPILGEFVSFKFIHCFFVRYNLNSPYLLKPKAKNYYFLAQNPAVQKPFYMKMFGPTARVLQWILGNILTY